MPVSSRIPRIQNRERGGFRGPQIAIALAAAATAAAIAVSASVLPVPLVLPVGSVMMLFLAGAIAMVAWKAPRAEASRVSYWDVSGALTLVGVCAALLSEPEHVLPLLEAAGQRK